MDKITSKISRSAGIYNLLVHSHLLFGLAVWGSTFPSYLVKLQRLQNKAIRIITNSDIHSPTKPKFHNLGILKISELYDFESAKIMHQHTKETLPSSLSTLFNKVSNIHSCNTRSVVHHNLYLPKFSTNSRQNSF